MDPIALQRQLRNNSSDLLNCYEDIKKWTGEMNQKEDELKTGRKTNQKVSHKTTKSKKADDLKPKKKAITSDYSSWDKYDVEAECAKLDGVKNEDSDENYEDEDVSEDDQDALQEASYQKEKGNQYVKQKKWDRAIECYTEAIKCYGYDAVYYANRALCYLKQENYKSAETDCTSSLQLDKTYVKAYQRRAAAREALGQLTEAKADILKVFDYEPNNKESKLALKKIEAQLLKTPKQKVVTEKSNLQVKFADSNLKELPQKITETQRPKSKFTLSREAAKKRNVNSSASTEKHVDSKKAEAPKISTYWPSGNDVQLVSAIKKPPHLRSEKSLKRIEILDGEPEEVETINKKVEYEHMIINDLKIVERKPPQEEEEIKPKVHKLEERKIDKIEEEIAVPTNYVQFACCWKTLTSDSRWKYLSKINPKNLPLIFKESLETDVFSEIIQILSKYCQDSSLVVYEYLLGLSNVKRFSMLVMFMSEKDTIETKQLFEQVKSNTLLSKEDVNKLIKKYGF